MARSIWPPYTSVSNCSTFGLLHLRKFSAILRIVTGTLVPAVGKGAQHTGAPESERSIHGPTRIGSLAGGSASVAGERAQYGSYPPFDYGLTTRTLPL
jgi:hypothetical protein